MNNRVTISDLYKKKYNSNIHSDSVSMIVEKSFSEALIENKLVNVKNIIMDSKSGYSGAGRGVHDKYKNKNLYESLSAYGVGFHRHNSEIQQELNSFTKKKVNFTFTPHLTPMFRGF